MSCTGPRWTLCPRCGPPGQLRALERQLDRLDQRIAG